MIKRLILLVVFGSASYLLLACDACSSLGSGGLGFYNYHNQNFIRLSWQQADYQSATGYRQRSKDDIQYINLTARWYITDRLSGQISQPWIINKRSDSNQSQSLAGLGDIRLHCNYLIIRNKKFASDLSINWDIGAGIKLPSGKYDSDIHDQNLPENFNLGNGSWGYLTETNIILKRNNVGGIIGGAYQYNSKSNSNYQFGHQVTGQFSLFLEKNLSETTIITPNIGTQYEQISQDRYANENIVSGTGAKSIFHTLGCNIKNNKWLGGVSYAYPSYQRYANGEVNAKRKLNIQITYIL